ncbi:MAG: endonuclease/exonuclease/phosphatase family protein [Chloroflexi bacterium]|nr:endonuclease/exonuclease/phosphatase family protein [Chloroflexota bacterium]
MKRWIALLIVPLALLAAACADEAGAPETTDTPADEATSTAPLPTDTPTPGSELLIVNYNILHGLTDEDLEAQPFDRVAERIEIIASQLAELRPDIVTLQEIFVNKPEGYPDIRGILLAALGGEYTAVFGGLNGAPIDGGGLGQMTFTRLDIRSTENRSVGLVQVSVGSVRAVHRVTVETESGLIDIYNAHLEGTEPDPQLAIDEIERVLAFIEETRSGTGPVILAGDFNATPDDPAIQALLAAGFVDVLVAGGDATCEGVGDPGCTSGTPPLGDNPEILTSRRIDYIFILPGTEFSLDARQASLFLNAPATLDDGGLLWASDHIGVQTLLELSR